MLDQTGIRRLDPGGSYIYRDPVWSPDSSRISYTRYETYDHVATEKYFTGEIFVIDTITRHTSQLTHNDFHEFTPTWSSDGRRIVYVREETVYAALVQDDVITHSLRIVNSDGTEDQELFVCPFVCGAPDWSPEGDRIAFHMAQSDLTSELNELEESIEIYTISDDGTELARLTQGDNHAREPRWSPDGARIVFRRTENNSIHIVEVQSGVETAFNLKEIIAVRDPTWAPDQSGIVFAAFAPGRTLWQLYFFSLVDGSTVPLLTATDDADSLVSMSEPDWAPDGNQLVYNLYSSKLYLVDVSHLISESISLSDHSHYLNN